MQYMGQSGVNTTTYESAREDDCLVCAFINAKVQLSKDQTLAQLIAKVTEEHKLKKPSFNLASSSEILYIPAPESLEKMHRHKLELTLAQLIEKGTIESSDGSNFALEVLDKNIKSRMILSVAIE